MTDPNKLKAINSPDPNTTKNGLNTESLSFLHSSRWLFLPLFKLPVLMSKCAFAANLLCLLCFSLITLLLTIATLYVSLNKHKNRISQMVLKPTTPHTTFLHPTLSATALDIAGPTAPPISGAMKMSDMALPRWSEGNMSPTMAGLSTFEATAMPVRQRDKMSVGTEVAVAVRMVNKMRRRLVMLRVG